MAPTTGSNMTGKAIGPPVTSGRVLRTDAGKTRPTRTEIEKQGSLVIDAKTGKEHLEKTGLVIEGEPYTVEALTLAIFYITQLPNVTLLIKEAIRAAAFVLSEMGKKYTMDTIIESIDQAIEVSTDRLQVLIETSIHSNTDIISKSKEALEESIAELKTIITDFNTQLTGATTKATQDITEASAKLTDTAGRTSTARQTYRDILTRNGRAGEH